jgi:hypothetical protein
MALFVRKIEYAKWAQRRILEGEQPSADAITNCMKTTHNTLSLWSIDDESELEDAVIAIAAQFDQLDTIDVLSIDPSLIEDRELPLKKTPGLSPYAAFMNRHLDVFDLDYNLLGFMAEVIVESIRQERKKRFTRSMLIRILKEAVDTGKVQWIDLKPNIQNKISNR